jgi:membrane protease subunit (stomatin/prohibitin family)
MGILGWFKRGVSEMMVARPDGTKSQVVWKHPEKTIPMKSQLTVEADEVAVFFRDGQVVSVLPPGRHTLDTSNLPFLSDLVDKFTGGNVFIAEVFFVTTREITGVKFGGRIGHVEDPKSGVPVEAMVHGEFSFRVEDAEKLIVGLVGLGRTQSHLVRSWMREQVLKVVRDRIAELLVKNRWPLLDVSSGAYTEEIETDVIEGIDRHVESYGIRVVRLGNFVVALDEEDSENLKKLYTDAAYLRTVGGVGAYREFAAGKAMLGAGRGHGEGRRRRRRGRRWRGPDGWRGPGGRIRPGPDARPGPPRRREPRPRDAGARLPLLREGRRSRALLQPLRRGAPCEGGAEGHGSGVLLRLRLAARRGRRVLRPVRPQAGRLTALASPSSPVRQRVHSTVSCTTPQS